MTTSLLCVYESHADCLVVDCGCDCHSITPWAAPLLPALDDIIRLVAERFPTGVQHPPILKALAFSAEALRFYSQESLSDPSTLVQAELDLCKELSIGFNFIEELSQELL